MGFWEYFICDFWCLHQNLKQMSLSEILFPDAKNSCMKKTTANLKLRNVPTNRLQQFVTQHGAKTKLERLIWQFQYQIMKKKHKKLHMPNLSNLHKLEANWNTLLSQRKSERNSKKCFLPCASCPIFSKYGLKQQYYCISGKTTETWLKKDGWNISRENRCIFRGWSNR